MATAHIEGEVSNARLQELLEDHPSDITRTLQSLCDQQFLVSNHKRRWATYTLFGKINEPPLFAEINDSSKTGSNVSENTGKIEIKFTHLTTSSTHNKSGSPHLSVSSPHLAVNVSQSESGTNRLQHPVAAKGKVPPDVMKKAILEVCTGRFRTLDELSKALDRNPAALRDRFLRQLVSDGKLKMKYQDKKNHPDQGYMTVEI